jgi:hypothetical protein
VGSLAIPERLAIAGIGVPADRVGPLDEGLVHEMGGPLPGRSQIRRGASPEHVSDSLASHQSSRSKPGYQPFL